MKKNLESYTETKDGKEVFFLKYLEENPVNLSAKINDEIIEIVEIFNDDLVFISADEYTGSDLVGIYSFKKGKVIFPFIIREFDTKDKSGFIYLMLEEGRLANENIFEIDLNPNNDFAYLHADGSAFQNEGIFFEKIGKSHYMLKDECLGADFIGENWSYKLYSNLFDTEDCTGYRGIYSYNYIEEESLLIMNITNKAVVLNILNSQICFTTLLAENKELEFINSNFFSISFDKFCKILNKDGQTVCCYSLSYSHNLVGPEKGEFMVVGDDTFHEFNFLNEIYICEANGLHIYNDYITIDATNALTNHSSTILLSKTGELKFYEVNLKELNELFKKYALTHHTKYFDQLKNRISVAKKSGIKIEQYDFLHSSDFSDLPKLKEADLTEIKNIREKYARVKRLEEKQTIKNDAERLAGKIVSSFKHKFISGSYFKINDGGTIQHLYYNNFEV